MRSANLERWFNTDAKEKHIKNSKTCSENNLYIQAMVTDTRRTQEKTMRFPDKGYVGTITPISRTITN